MFATIEYKNEYGQVRIWNAKTGSEIKQLVGLCVAFSQSRYFAVACFDCISIYDTEDNFNLIVTVDRNEDEEGVDGIDSLVFYRNTKQSFLVSGYSNGTLKVWDTETMTSVKQFTAHTNNFADIAFGQNNLVATSSCDGTIKIWNCDTWELVQTLEEESRRNEVAFTQNDMLVVLSCSTYGTNSKIKIWCSESWSLVKQLESNKPYFCSIALSKSNLLAVRCDDGKILIFDTENLDLFQELEALAGINSLIAFDQNDFLSSGTREGKVVTWRKPEDVVFD
jgi:WD40 repeat protein